MNHLARVLIDKRNNLILTYRIPLELRSKLRQGSKVKVPLKTSTKIGTVLEIYNSDKKFKYPVKEIHSVKHKDNLVSDKLFTLASWIAEYYNEPEEFVLKAFLPKEDEKLRSADYRIEIARITKELNPKGFEQLQKKAPKQAEILAKLSKAGEALPITELGGKSDALKRLVQKKIIEFSKSDPADLDEFLLEKMQKLNAEEFVTSIPHDLNSGQKSALLLAEKYLAKICASEKKSGKAKDKVKGKDEANSVKPILLHGITGSGKTEVYLQLLAKVLEQGKSALILAPEIYLAVELASQIQRRFTQEKILLFHSKVADGRRMKSWKMTADGKCRIVVGTRSALFAPLKNLGVIIVDEEHDGAFKQESSPRYNARDVAVVRANLENALIILGSATPSLETFHNSNSGKYAMATLPERVDSGILPSVHILNMLRENVISGHGGRIICKKMISAISERLSKKEQVILFINRRGFASFFQCQSCGESVRCHNCSTTLRYHKSKRILLCHLCGYSTRRPSKCQDCGKGELTMIGFGTEKVLEIMATFFKKARLARLDTDLAESDKEKVIADFRRGEIDILVGTQMLAKGFHFPRVTLVGIINADQGLNMPDFRNNERTFQLLTQVAGRSGRGSAPGEVIVQTHVPHSSVIQFSRKHNYIDFAQEELEMRKTFSYPPFRRATLLRAYAETEETGLEFLEKVAKKMAEFLPSSGGVDISSAMPSPIERIENRFRSQVLIRTKSNSAIVSAYRKALRELKIPRGVKIFLDVDALSFL